MKPVFYKSIMLCIVIAGLFIGVVKGQEARAKWVNKMKSKYENKRTKAELHPDEIVLDDYEWQSFHNN